jgi:hypothetical protein
MAEECFWSLDRPIVPITTPHIPLPAADALEDMAIPSVERILATGTFSMRSRRSAREATPRLKVGGRPRARLAGRAG